MPRRYRNITLVTLFITLFGCHSGTTVLPIGTFVNASDATRILELKADPAQTANLFLRITIQTGANELFGKTVGVYTLKTSDGTSTGKFVFVKKLRGALIQRVILNADNGNEWSLTPQADGSLQDSAGVVWRLRAPGA